MFQNVNALGRIDYLASLHALFAGAIGRGDTAVFGAYGWALRLHTLSVIWLCNGSTMLSSSFACHVPVMPMVSFVW